MSDMRVVVSASTAGARSNISSILTKTGKLVIGETDNGAGTLRLIQSLQPDVAVIDIDSAPGLSIVKMLEDDGQIGIVLIGSHSRREQQGKLVSGFILKPVTEATLVTAVEFAAAGQNRLQKMADELAKMKNTLETRKLVERAKGILMETLGVSEPEAYRRIQQQSMNKRVSLKRIAEAVITAHEFQ
ncbi:MAG: ANTAR domain-containing protein [Firmicutes bacterium]|nr:ANTAR domain-containing protein [Bacillota bacterium]